MSDTHLDNPLCEPLPMPAFGETTRLERGSLHLLLEHDRSGFLLVVHDGTQGRRFRLGLPRDGRLELRVRPPDYRVQVQVQDVLCLAPHGRIRGYVAVPVQHRLVWRGDHGAGEPILDLPSPDLRTAWLGEGEDGGYTHSAASAFYSHLHGVDPALKSMVPVVVINASAAVVRPAHLALTLRERDLLALRGRILSAPRRIVFTADDHQQERVRAMPRLMAEIGA